MKRITSISLVFFVAFSLTVMISTGVSMAKSRNICYEVKVTNMTRGQVFTPVLVVTHKRGVKLFNVGDPVSDELAQLAEGGDTAPLADLLATMTDLVGDIAVSEGGPFGAGDSVTVHIQADRRVKHISLASMLAITNDGFVSLNDVPINGKMYVSPVYDAGSELNDELAENIPGTGGLGYSVDDGEGFVHIHAGIQGIGNLKVPENLDWRNPAAKITITRIRCTDE